MTGVRLHVNGEPRTVAPGTTVAGLVAEMAGDQRRVAVAVNGDVVERRRWEDVELDADDQVEILTAIQGGGPSREHQRDG